jgi:hypothetical protein
VNVGMIMICKHRLNAAIVGQGQSMSGDAQLFSVLIGRSLEDYTDTPPMTRKLKSTRIIRETIAHLQNDRSFRKTFVYALYLMLAKCRCADVR